MGAGLHKMLEKIDITALPSLPHLLLKLLAICDQEDVTIGDLAALLRQDAVLSAKVIASASSRISMVSTRQSLLLSALQTLGVEEVRGIALNSALISATVRSAADWYEIRQLWRHALITAQMAQALAVKTAYADSEEAYLAGLLHDIGRNALWIGYPADYIEVQANSQDEGVLMARESRLLGVNHAEVGGAIVRSWGMRSFLADAIRYHHETATRLTNAHPLLRIVSVAQHLTELDENKPHDAQMLSLLNLSPADAQAVAQLAHVRLHEAEHSLGLNSEPVAELAGNATRTEEGERRRHRADPGRVSPSAQEVADQRVREKLAERVRDMVMFDTLKNGMFAAVDNAAWRGALNHSLQAAFGLKDVMLFLPQGRDGMLRGVGEAAEGLASQILIPPDDPYSMLALTLRQGQPAHSLQPDATALTVLDEQVIGLTGKSGMLCLPLLDTGVPMGLVVCGIDQADVALLDERLPLLTRFIRQAARALRQKQAVKAASAPRNEQARKIMHEVNNPLNIVKNYLRILGAKLPQDDPAQGDLKIITDEIDRVGSLLKGLLGGQANGNKAVAAVVDINRLVLEVVGLLKPTLLTPGRVQVETLLAADLPELLSDAGQIKQILHNLIKNAAEAMSEGGKLHLATSRLQQGPDMWVELRIEDSGSGIPDAIRTQLFRPLTTTKDGDHAGLGLSIVHGLVKGLGGVIECEAQPVGTAFIVRLPANGKRH
ncbi:HDOD domain-containing protein [Sulfuriferula sp. GW1]|uniref:HDOD domain-containing protein n=1 Tax=Sulfuriferula sp. GW1 TaxID=3345111 RepID=UPI0039AF1A38